MKRKFAPTVLGDRVRELDLGWSRIVEAVHRPGLRLVPHEHLHPALTLVREGGFQLDLAGEEFECDRRGVFFKLGAHRHSNRFGPGGSRSLVIELHPDHGSPWLEPVPLARASFQSRDPRAVRLAREIEREFRGADLATDLALEGLILELLAFLLRADPRRERRDTPGWLDTAIEFLRESLPGRVTLRDVADRVGVHPVHLARVFRRRMGCSLGEYVRGFRVDRAAELLVETDLGLADVALSCGFYDQAHFSRAFKERMGVPPGVYRRASRP